MEVIEIPPEAHAYGQMQKRFYDESDESPEAIVGSYDYHENFPYETNLLYRFGDIRKPVLPDLANAIGFDVGCGEGRMIRRMSDQLGRVDGCDISQKMVDAASARCPQSNVFLTSGADCGAAASNAYDFAYCTISLHHICVYDVRAAIIGDIVRILKPDGCATLQFFFSKHFPYLRSSIPVVNSDLMADIHHKDHWLAHWHENKTDVTGTNSACDVAFGTNDIDTVVTDLKRWFSGVDIWFYDVSVGRSDSRGGGRARVLPDTHPNSHHGDEGWATHMAFLHLRGPRKS